jgi:hypothetical protein
MNDERKQAMRTRLGLKVLGLSALVMGVMAIGTAGVAQAEVGACWGYLLIDTVEGKEVTTLPCFSTTLEAKPLVAIENATGTHPSAATLLVESLNLEITCTEAKFIEGGTLSVNGSILLGRVEFGGCFTRKSTAKGLELIVPCDPHDPVTGLGRIRTEKGTGLIVLHNGEPVVELKPDTVGGPLAKIALFEGCPIAEEVIVTGKLILSDIGGKAGFEEHKLIHLIREFPSLKLMKVGANTVSIDGTAEVRLDEPHNALKWGGHGA